MGRFARTSLALKRNGKGAYSDKGRKLILTRVTDAFISASAPTLQPVRRAQLQNMALNEVHSVRRAAYKQDQQWRTARRRLWRDVCDFTDGCVRNGWV